MVWAHTISVESLLFGKNNVASAKPKTGIFAHNQTLKAYHPLTPVLCHEHVTPIAEWMTSSAVLTGVPLMKWLFIYNKRNQRQADDFLQLLAEVRPFL